MSPESEGDRDQRIRNAQLESRNRGSSQRSLPNAQQSTPRRKVVARAKNKPSESSSLSMLPGGTRDIVIGVAIGLIPAILALVLLHSLFGLILAVVIVAIAGGVGYLLGNQTS